MRCIPLDISELLLALDALLGGYPMERAEHVRAGLHSTRKPVSFYATCGLPLTREGRLDARDVAARDAAAAQAAGGGGAGGSASAQKVEWMWVEEEEDARERVIAAKLEAATAKAAEAAAGKTPESASASSSSAATAAPAPSAAASAAAPAPGSVAALTAAAIAAAVEKGGDGCKPKYMFCGDTPKAKEAASYFLVLNANHFGEVGM